MVGMSRSTIYFKIIMYTSVKNTFSAHYCLLRKIKLVWKKVEINLSKFLFFLLLRDFLQSRESSITVENF